MGEHRFAHLFCSIKRNRPEPLNTVIDFEHSIECSSPSTLVSFISIYWCAAHTYHITSSPWWLFCRASSSSLPSNQLNCFQADWMPDWLSTIINDMHRLLSAYAGRPVKWLTTGGDDDAVIALRGDLFVDLWENVAFSLRTRRVVKGKGARHILPQECQRIYTCDYIIFPFCLILCSRLAATVCCL